MSEQAGPLVIIGGHEDKEGDRAILRAVAEAVAGRRLVLATIASRRPEGYLDAYRTAFEGLGIGELVELYLDSREDAYAEETLALLDDAGGVFFSGGDQLRITSQIGDTPVEARVREVRERGGVIAGTSAGASAMSDTMLVRGAGTESHRLGDLRMAPGLAFLTGITVDQHFAERGRIGRLLGAVAQNPRVLGVGIDEDTAIVVRGDRFEVLGSGGVYVVDGSGVTRSNIAESKPETTLSISDVRLHLLSAGDAFRMSERRPESAC
ncbi:MAG: cyanophycinase [Naasia sp.]|nr:cyanophycinase [Naasia sp.]